MVFGTSASPCHYFRLNDRFSHTPCLENEGTGLLALHFLGMTPGVPDFPTAHMHSMKIHKENTEKIMTQ